MPEVVADRSSYSRSKRHEISLITTSRKRKLRELYAVHSTYGAEQPIPFIAVEKLEDHPTTPAEEQFLADHDISRKNKSLEEAIPPTRRQLRSGTPKTPFKGSGKLDGRPIDKPRIASKGPRQDGARNSRTSSPLKEASTASSNGFLNAPDVLHHGRPPSRPDRSSTTTRRSSRASSRGSQAELPPSSAELLDTIVDESIAEAARKPLLKEETPSHSGFLEVERIKERVESRPGSPGVDPRKAIPISAEDIANLSEPIIIGMGDKHHRAATVHLPPKEEQEKRLQDVEEMRAEKAKESKKAAEGGHLSIRLPPPNGSRTFPEPMSSPGSTVDALSATTPAQHEASTDTSPENDAPRYHLDRSDEKDEIPETPPQGETENDVMLDNQEQVQEQEAAFDIQKDAVRADALGSSPTAVEAQLRLEEEQAATALIKGDQQAMCGDNPHEATQNELLVPDSQESQGDRHFLTDREGKLVQNMVEDEDEVVGVPTPEEDKISRIKSRPEATSNRGIGSSSSDRRVPEDMDVDASGDSFTLAESSIHIVDTVTSRQADVEASLPSEVVLANKKDTRIPTTSTSTPRRTLSAPAPAPTPPTQERMTTRVASGAMRHKSVSEILGEIPRPNTAASERTAVKGSIDPDSTPDSTSQSRSSTPQSPASRMRAALTKEKERSKLSTVVFAKQTNDRSANMALVPNSKDSLDGSQVEEYFMPIIKATAVHNGRYPQLEALLQQAHKTVTTSNMYVPVQEKQTLNILRRVNRLQHEDRWSFRQLKRCPEPNRPTTHWDELLKEAKWMRTDFREERKWKITAARNLAYDCADWVNSDATERKGLQVHAVIPTIGELVDTEMRDATSSAPMASHTTPDLVPSAENDSPTDDFDDEPRMSLVHNVAPATMFALGDNDVVFNLRRSLAADRLLEELPMYGIPLKVPRSGLPTSDEDPDASWRLPAIPLSKYMQGKIVLVDEGPPRKKSRYEYEEEEEEDEDQVVFGENGSKRTYLPPVLTEVALFNPDNKHIRARIHAGHQFRPPSEFPMPLQSFFECRLASQWTWPEDDELKALVREYSYNWQLISCLVTSPSMYSSGAERRTPWECFERWIHLEGLPADMIKTHYFRAYNNRLEAAQSKLMSMAQAAPPVNVAGAMVPARRRTTTSVRVERRRNQKHLTLVDAMRKLAKKRETTQQKQQQSAQLIAQRKPADQGQPQTAKHTPQDFSRLKHERELQLQERMARLQQQQEAQRRALAQARNPQGNPQPYGASNNGGSQQPRNLAVPTGVPAANLPPNVNRPNQLGVPGQNMPRPQMQPMPNGMGVQIPMPNPGNLPQIPMNGVSQGQINGMPGLPNMPNMPNMQNMAGRQPAPSDVQLFQQARRISEQQRQAVQMQQQSQQQPGQPQVHNSPPNMRTNMAGNMNNMNNMNGMSQQAFMQNNQLMMAAYNMNGVSTPPANGFNVQGQGQAGSPRMGHPNQALQMPNGSASPQIAHLEQHFRTKHPNATPEQVTKFVRDTLQQSMQRTAMHAAAGNGTSLQGMPGGMQNSPQQYAQMLRAQQQRQAASAEQQGRSASGGSQPGNSESAK